MQENSNHARYADEFTMPMLEFEVTSLEEFIAQEVFQPGLPLFILQVETSLCKNLILCLWSCAEGVDKFSIKHEDIMGCLRILHTRLMLIKSVFEHGKRCCEQQYQWPDSRSGLTFTIKNQYQNLETAIAQQGFSHCFPLLAVINSVTSCVGIISCLLKCGGEGDKKQYNQDSFHSVGDEAILSALMMVQNQLELIIQSTNIAQTGYTPMEKNVKNK